MDELIDRLISGPEEILRDWMALQMLMRPGGMRYYVVHIRAIGRRAFTSTPYTLQRAIILQAASASDAVEDANDALLPPGTWHVLGTEIRDCGDASQLTSVISAIEVATNYRSAGAAVSPVLPTRTRQTETAI